MERKRKESRREVFSFRLDPELNKDLKKIHDKYHDRFSRVRSNLLDTGLRISLKLIQTYGPVWFFDNMKVLPEEILARLEGKR